MAKPKTDEKKKAKKGGKKSKGANASSTATPQKSKPPARRRGKGVKPYVAALKAANDLVRRERELEAENREVLTGLRLAALAEEEKVARERARLQRAEQRRALAVSQTEEDTFKVVVAWFNRAMAAGHVERNVAAAAAFNSREKRVPGCAPKIYAAWAAFGLQYVIMMITRLRSMSRLTWAFEADAPVTTITVVGPDGKDVEAVGFKVGSLGIFFAANSRKEGTVMPFLVYDREKYPFGIAEAAFVALSAAKTSEETPTSVTIRTVAPISFMEVEVIVDVDEPVDELVDVLTDEDLI